MLRFGQIRLLWLLLHVVFKYHQHAQLAVWISPTGSKHLVLTKDYVPRVGAFVSFCRLNPYDGDFVQAVMFEGHVKPLIWGWIGSITGPLHGWKTSVEIAMGELKIPGSVPTIPETV